MWLEGFEHLDQCLDAGRGAFLFSNHGAGGALFLVSFGLLGYKVNIIGRSVNEEDNPFHPVVLKFVQRRIAWIEKMVLMAPSQWWMWDNLPMLWTPTG